ncbi:MAG: hypothetical protein IKZ01_03430, partial [Anaerotignum sp.]|nr:hypothetical protein [Anaerotignum sp.]
NSEIFKGQSYDCPYFFGRLPAPFAKIRIFASENRSMNRSVPAAKPRNRLFSSPEINSVCGFYLGNGFVSQTLPLHHFIFK